MMKKITYAQLWKKFDAWFINVHPVYWVAFRVLGFVLGLTVWFFALIVSIILISTSHDVSFIKYFPLLGFCIISIGLFYVLVIRKHQE